MTTPRAPHDADARIVSLIVAVAANGVIGAANRLPWHLPADLRYFKATTLGRPVIMGRRTFESIGRPLPGRVNIVVTRSPERGVPGCVTADSLAAAYAAAGGGEVFVIGGAALFAEALPHADRLYVTEIHAPFDGDVRFPDVDRGRWRETAREVHEGEAPFRFDFVRYLRAP